MTIFQDKLVTRTDCDEAGDYSVPNVLSPRDLVFRPDLQTKTVQYTHLAVPWSSRDKMLISMRQMHWVPV